MRVHRRRCKSPRAREMVTPADDVAAHERRQSIVTVGVNDVLAEPREVRGDLAGDLRRAHSADSQLEVADRPRSHRIGDLDAGRNQRDRLS